MSSGYPVVDIHSHFLPKEWPDLERRFGSGDWPWMRHEGNGKATVMIGDRPFRPVYDACWDPSRRLEEMDRDAIDLQIISATPVLFGYHRPVRQASECARLFNDAALEICARGRNRLFSLCQVPLQDTDAACAELTRAMRDGHLGVQIGSHVDDRNLDDEGLITFLQHCATEDAAVLVHPWDMMGGIRTAKYMMAWIVAMPAETQLSILSLILSGAFERLPTSLELCFAHGGGSFAFLLGRVDNAWHRRDIVREDCPKPPSAYVDRLHVDAAVFSNESLNLLTDVMGSDRVMYGSDYPFPLGELRMGQGVRNNPLLSQAEKDRILGLNAVQFFRLGASDS